MAPEFEPAYKAHHGNAFWRMNVYRIGLEDCFNNWFFNRQQLFGYIHYTLSKAIETKKAGTAKINAVPAFF